MTAVQVVVSAVTLGLSVAVLLGPSPGGVRRRRLRCGGTSPGWTPWARSFRSGPRVLVPAVGCGGVLVVVGPSAVLLAGTVALVLVGAQWLYAGGRRRRATERGRRQTVEVCDALAAEMRSGQPAARAMLRAADMHPALWPATRACALGSDVPTALRRAAAAPDAPGAGGLATVAAAWQVADDAGAGLASALERVADSLRADEATQQEVAASLSPARATARMLAVLPGFGLMLGAGLGGDPLGLLLGSTTGNLLLLVGVALALAGTVWVERLADRVQA